MLTPAEIDHLTDITSDAYSFDRYASWRACVTLLARRGYTYAEAETILRSKWMRWAGDSSDKCYGRVTSRDLARWLDRCSATTCSRAALDSMLILNGLRRHLTSIHRAHRSGAAPCSRGQSAVAARHKDP